MTTEEIANYHQQQAAKQKQQEKKNSLQEGEDDKFDDPLLYGKDAQEEADMLESDYILLPEPVSLMSVTPISIMDSTDITNHIVHSLSLTPRKGCLRHPPVYLLLPPPAESQVPQGAPAHRHPRP
jgi:hypothetical protein